MSAENALQGKVAVVTGANRGIGRAIATAMSEAGATVVVAARDVDEASAVAASLPRAQAVRCDVTDEASVDALGDAVIATHGRVDVVVANAGVAGPTLPMHEISLRQWRDCEAVNVDGVFLSFRRFVPQMIAQGSGSLIALSSITGKRPLLNRTPYAASKMAVIGLVRTLATELGPHGIRVNSICPGAVSGERIEQVIAAQAAASGEEESEILRRFTEPAALRRLVAPEEVAAAAVFLASDAASSITGIDLNVAAGLVMH